MDSAQYMAKDDYSEWMERNKMLCVTIYADTTDLFTEAEVEEMVNSPAYFTEMIDIPVPEDLLKQWWYDCIEFDRNPDFVEEPEGGWAEATDDDFWKWFKEESTADDTDSLYNWLVAHNYYWRRVDKQ